MNDCQEPASHNRPEDNRPAAASTPHGESPIGADTPQEEERCFIRSSN